MGTGGAPAGAWLHVKTIGLRQAAERNIIAESDRWFPWGVVAFAGGSLIYFALKTEPSPGLAGFVALSGVVIAILALKSSAIAKRFFCILLAASCLGFGAAKLRTELVDGPIISSDIGPLRLEGRIESVLVQDASHARILIAPSKVGRALS